MIKSFIMRTVKKRVLCWHGEHQVKEVGYSETRTVFTQMFKQHRKWFFIPLPSKVLFYEEIPIWAKSQLACCGYTDWKSDAPQWMHNAVKHGWVYYPYHY